MRPPPARRDEGHSLPARRDHHPQRYEPSPPPPSTPASSSYGPSSSTPVGSYYRRNYEARVWEYETPESSSRYGGRSGNSSRLSRSSSRYQSRDNDSAEGPRRSRFPARLITLLIQDVRSGTTDHQLAEVKVPLRPGSSPDDGFWADARDIVSVAFRLYLQSSVGPPFKERATSKRTFKNRWCGTFLSFRTSCCKTKLSNLLLGPARAYTLRGKYRQFILRVSADNEDEFLSANVIIQKDKTLDIIVEMVHFFAIVVDLVPLHSPALSSGNSSSTTQDTHGVVVFSGRRLRPEYSLR